GHQHRVEPPPLELAVDQQTCQSRVDDAEMKTLSQWRITDPQGYVTTVTLSNLQKGKSVDGSLFFINYGRSEDKAMQQQIQQSQK
ncbi:outer membrane lipoprotein carrier protein LolA, partial [Methylobacterium organophilum]|nr:outer membrane lipoprotein carrier protein LolA [Methylobacterium organophilum]